MFYKEGQEVRFELIENQNGDEINFSGVVIDLNVYKDVNRLNKLLLEGTYESTGLYGVIKIEYSTSHTYTTGYFSIPTYKTHFYISTFTRKEAAINNFNEVKSERTIKFLGKNND